MAEPKGVWRTVRGRRVFIGEGEDLYTAMEKSGKFKELGKRETYQSARNLNNKYTDFTNAEYWEFDKNVKKRISSKNEERKQDFNKILEDGNRKLDKEGYIPKHNTQEKQRMLKKEYMSHERYYPEKDKIMDYYFEYGAKSGKWKDPAEDDLERANKRIEEFKKRKGKEVKEDTNKIDNFNKYKKVQMSGKYNMITQAQEAMDEAGLSEEEYFDVIKNYSNYSKQAQDNYESKVYGSNVKKADEEMKNRLGYELHYAGEDLYSDDPYRNMSKDEMRAYNEKMENWGKEEAENILPDDDNYNYAVKVKDKYGKIGYMNGDEDSYKFWLVDDKTKVNKFANNEQDRKAGKSRAEYNGLEYLGMEKIKEDDISPMSEFSDTTGTGLSDLQMKAIKDKEFRASLGEVDIPDNFKAQFDDYANKRDYEEKPVFTQKDDMYGGEFTYTQKELDDMAKNKIKPMETSYGHKGAWKGINVGSYSDKEIGQKVNDYMKKKHPGVKLSRSTKNGIDFNIMSSDKPIVITDKDIDKMQFSDLENVTRTNQFEWWAKDNIEGYNENHSYKIEDARKYAKKLLGNGFSGLQIDNKDWFLTDYGKEVVNDLQVELDSYNYDDSNGMVDYFDRGFYDSIEIGKYNKPYETIENFKRRKGKK